MWAHQGALPAKQWPPGRQDPRSARGKMPAAEQGVQAARPQQAPGGCGDSTQKIHLGSKYQQPYERGDMIIPTLLMRKMRLGKVALFQYWL